MSKHTDFYKILRLLNENQRKFEYVMKSSSLSFNEKKITKNLLLYKKGKSHLVLEHLRDIEFSEPYLEALREYIVGMAHNHNSNFKFGHEHLEKSVFMFEKLGEEEFIFYPLITLAFNSINRSNLSLAQIYIKKIEVIDLKYKYDQLQRAQAQAYFYEMKGQDQKAKSVLIKSLDNLGKYKKTLEPNFLLLLIMVEFKLSNMDNCFLYLERYKASKGFRVRENYKFMKLILNYLASDEPMYVYDKDFENTPELKDQLSIINLLTRSDEDEAIHRWNKLRAHNPKLYGENFSYSGRKCMFSEALLKAKSCLIPELNIDLEHFKMCRTKLKKLDYLFSCSQGRISKSLIIKHLWNEEYSEVVQNRLWQLLKRYKKEYNKEVESYQELYILKDAA